MKNFKRSKKALSPVVASIILIAVTVAVSIAVAAWMGALTIGFMQTEQVKITGVQFTDDTGVEISVINQGTSGVTISEVSINGVALTEVYNPNSPTVSANGQATVTDESFVWNLGNSYQVRLVTATGNVFMYSAVA
ncbi:MAG TPA: archaellin/type IV pilin N-terminal domain-containing protein [Candidatus Bathyarchaeia archaeon]|nr:archaellin/type IV pilin N-terminal domain-containing protein [Candidatus Bathyarchaeia archaeon]